MNTELVKIILFDLAALLTVLGFVYAFLKNRQDKLDARFNRHEDKINDLSATCARREEISITVNAAITPINHQLTEIRHRQDDVYSLLTKLKK